MNRLKRNPIRGATFGAAFAIAAAALAFFAVTYIGDGEHQGTTGGGSTQSLPVTISFPDGLTPTNRVPISAEVENTTSGSLSFKNFTLTAETPTVPKCASEWLRFRAEVTSSGLKDEIWDKVIHGEYTGTIGPYAPGKHAIFTASGTGVYLEFSPTKSGETDQSSCQEVPVKVKGHLSQ